MDIPENSHATSARTSKGKDQRRRIWSEREEKQLVLSLKEIITIGWKCENGFHFGYLTTLEKMMLKAFPDTDLRADPHINSKIYVWKKNYGSITTMLSRSGFGWNDVKNELLVDSDDVWDNYVKTDPNAKNLRRKSFPYFKYWCEIFGKDRATGENAMDINDVAAEHQEPYIPVFSDETAPGWEDFTGGLGRTVDDARPSMSREASSETTTKQKNNPKKRKAPDTSDSEILSMMETFCTTATAKLGDIANKMGYEFALAHKRSTVYAALGQLGGLSVKDKISVGKRIVNNKADMDMFFSLPDADKPEMVRMILHGQYH